MYQKIKGKTVDKKAKKIIATQWVPV